MRNLKYLLSLKVFKNDDVIKMHGTGTQYFLLILFSYLFLVPKCSFVLKQLLYDILMLGNECLQNSFKNKVYK